MNARVACRFGLSQGLFVGAWGGVGRSEGLMTNADSR
jgi:hypothetical protein